MTQQPPVNSIELSNFIMLGNNRIHLMVKEFEALHARKKVYDPSLTDTELHRYREITETLMYATAMSAMTSFIFATPHATGSLTSEAVESAQKTIVLLNAISNDIDITLPTSTSTTMNLPTE